MLQSIEPCTMNSNRQPGGGNPSPAVRQHSDSVCRDRTRPGSHFPHGNPPVTAPSCYCRNSREGPFPAIGERGTQMEISQAPTGIRPGTESPLAPVPRAPPAPPTQAGTSTQLSSPGAESYTTPVSSAPPPSDFELLAAPSYTSAHTSESPQTVTTGTKPVPSCLIPPPCPTAPPRWTRRALQCVHFCRNM